MSRSSLIYTVTHSPDGGDEYLVAAFARKGDAVMWARERVADPNADIRLIEVWDGLSRGRRKRIASFGWAAVRGSDA